MAAARGTAAAASTAEAAAALRAAANAERDCDIRGPDHLAGRLVSNALRLTLLAKVPLLRRIGPRVAERILPGSYWFELARTKYMDEILEGELSAGLQQLVILGAGFDTRAYRYADQLDGIATYEVDHPATASLKRHRVRRIFGALPGHLRYVDLDLDLDDITKRCRQTIVPAAPSCSTTATETWSLVTTRTTARHNYADASPRAENH